jgi:hypothetical protein
MIIDEYFIITHEKDSLFGYSGNLEVDIYCLTELSVSKRQSVIDSIVNEYEAVGGMRIDTRNRNNRRKLAEVPLLHKSRTI